MNNSMVPKMQLKTPWNSHWRPEFVGTLLFLVHQDEVLLIHKKTGHGAGRINAPGGKIEPGEDIVTCACREMYEETGVEVSDARVGVEMRFVERNGPQWLGFALLASKFSGEPVETREALPFWCPLTEIPYAQMWPDDEIWLPRLLQETPEERQDKPLVGNFLFENEQLLEYEFEQCESVWRNF